MYQLYSFTWHLVIENNGVLLRINGSVGLLDCVGYFPQ